MKKIKIYEIIVYFLRFGYVFWGGIFRVIYYRVGNDILFITLFSNAGFIITMILVLVLKNQKEVRIDEIMDI